MPTIVLPSEPTPNPEPEHTDPETPETPVIVLSEDPRANPEAPADQPETLPHPEDFGDGPGGRRGPLGHRHAGWPLPPAAVLR